MTDLLIRVGIAVVKATAGNSVSNKAESLVGSVFNSLEDEVYPKGLFGKRKLCKELRKKDRKQVIPIS